MQKYTFFSKTASFTPYNIENWKVFSNFAVKVKSQRSKVKGKRSKVKSQKSKALVLRP
jgi:hypothetical protein